MMGGAFPQGSYECNFEGRCGGVDTKYAIDNWPTPILFSGFEIGEGIKTGKSLATTPLTNPVRRAYDINGHSSWDLTAALAAVEDPTLYWNISPEGSCEILPPAGNQWHATPNRSHAYLIAKAPPAEVAKVLDDLLALPPGKK
jgi:hypothetical protein